MVRKVLEGYGIDKSQTVGKGDGSGNRYSRKYTEGSQDLVLHREK